MDSRRRSAWSRLFFLVLATLAWIWNPSTTTGSAATFAYDAPAVALVDVHQLHVANVGSVLLGDEGKESASQSIDGQRTSTTPVATVVVTEAASGAWNAATAPALARQLAGEEASSIFTSSGGLQQSVIDASREIIPGTGLSNGQLIKTLTADGSSIADWGKFSTPTFNSPSGPFQVHFYMNPSTGIVHYLDDYKVVFNGAR